MEFESKFNMLMPCVCVINVSINLQHCSFGDLKSSLVIHNIISSRACFVCIDAMNLLSHSLCHTDQVADHPPSRTRDSGSTHASGYTALQEDDATTPLTPTPPQNQPLIPPARQVTSTVSPACNYVGSN